VFLLQYLQLAGRLTVKLGADQENQLLPIIGSSFCPSHHSVRLYTHLSFFYNRPALRLYSVHPFRSKFKNCTKRASVVSLVFRPYWGKNVQRNWPAR